MKSNWSRRELYALGETLGDCVTERKLGGGYLCGGGGKGGGGQPSQTTAYQTNLPEYAKPYVTTMLEATQKQLFNTQPGAGGTTDITGFKPYTPYSSDPTKYFAGPSSLQTMGYNEAAGMQTPGQFTPATGLAQAAGMGQLGTAQQAQGLGAAGMGIGAAGMSAAAPAFRAGADYMRGVTDPSQVSAFMSPYQQAVTDVAKSAAIRDAQMANQAMNLASARSGTYGGARQALAQSERERGLLSNLANIQAQGSQSAYDKAIQQMQYGSNLGLQGIQTGLQGVQAGQQGVSQGLAGLGAQQAAYGGAGNLASTLGGLGTAQQAADVSRIGLQQQLGSAQQQYQQNIINQAIQDYATAQQYPMMQLGFMSNMLRGLPLQATTTQSYMPTPNLTTQAISGLGTAAGAYKAFGFKEGGSVPGYAGPEGSVVSGMKAKLEAIADTPGGVQQVSKIAETSPSVEMRKIANEVLMEKQLEQRAAAQAEQSIAQDQQPRGLAAAPAPVLDTMGAAGGGIVAFAGPEGSDVEEDDKYGQYVADIQKARARAGVEGSPIDPKLKAMYEERIAGLGGRRESDTGLNMIDFFSRMNKPGSTLSAGIAAAGEALPGIAARRKELAADELAATKGLADLSAAERAEKLGISKEALAAYEKEMDREKSLEVARIGARERATDLDRTTTAFLNELLADGAPDNAATRAQARKLAIAETGLLDRKVGLQEEVAVTNRIKNDPAIKALKIELYSADEKDKPAIQEKIAAREAEIKGDIKRPGTPTKADTSSGRFPKPDISKVPNVPEGSSIGAQTDKGWEVKNKDGKVIGHIQK